MNIKTFLQFILVILLMILISLPISTLIILFATSLWILYLPFKLIDIVFKRSFAEWLGEVIFEVYGLSLVLWFVPIYINIKLFDE